MCRENGGVEEIEENRGGETLVKDQRDDGPRLAEPLCGERGISPKTQAAGSVPRHSGTGRWASRQHPPFPYLLHTMSQYFRLHVIICVFRYA